MICYISMWYTRDILHQFMNFSKLMICYECESNSSGWFGSH